jgi:hypothetical protein
VLLVLDNLEHLIGGGTPGRRLDPAQMAALLASTRAR